jgi:hypothetical protein
LMPESVGAVSSMTLLCAGHVAASRRWNAS